MLSAGRLFLLSVALKATLVHTTPTLSFPINSQVPPVARVGDLFSFVFSARTFTSSDGTSLSYSLTNPPSWLSLDSDARTLSGTPQDGDIASGTVVGLSLTVVASDSTGSTTDDATLVVSREEAPSVQIPISDQIQTFGDYSEPSSIIYSPEEYFKFAFATDTFAAPDASLLNYYSVLADNSPLPAWLSFDPSSLAFAGTTPPFSSLVEPPQTFSVKLIASDVTGFSAASLNFSIVVGTHTLATSQPDVTLNATAGEPLEYAGLAGSIKVDGKTADSSQVKATTEDLPTWLSFDSASWNISGTPPATAASTSFVVVMEDAYADILNVTFNVQLTSPDSLFQSTFPALSVTPGENFSFDLTPYLLDPSNLVVTTDVQPATSWISWDASSLTLSGDAPSSAPKSVVDVTFTVAQKSSAKSKRGDTSQSQQLVIQIEPAPETATTSATSSSTSSTSSSTKSSPTTAAPADSTSSPPHSTKWTIVAIVISVVAAFAIIASICLWCCARRRKKAAAKRFTRSTTSTDPEDTYIHTQGHPIHSPTTVSPNEKAAEKPALTIWQANNSTSRLPPPTPASGVTPAAGFSLGAFHNNSTTIALAQQQQTRPPSTAASTPVKKVKDYFHSSLRSLRVIHVLPASRLSSRRASTGSSLHDDEGHSHYDGDFLPDLGLGASTPAAAGSGAPVLTLPIHHHHHHHHGSSQTSFRDALEGSLPERSGGTSLQITPETAYVSTAEQRRRAERRMSSRRRSKGKSVQGRIVTPGYVVRRQNSTADPFTDTVAAATNKNNTPIPSTSAHDPNANHFSSTHPAIHPSISPITPPSPTAPTDPDKPLRPTHSQKSFTSTASSSLSLSRKLGRKVSAQARGAWQLTLLQSPGRRTRAALRSSMKARRNKKRGPVLEDDESTAAARSVSSPIMTGRRSASALDSRSEMGSRGGARTADLYSPRAWPRPSTATTRNVTAPLDQHRAISLPQQQQQQQQGIPKRRPVPSYPPPTGSATLPLPLTPVRSDHDAAAVHSNKKAVSTPAGLGILNATYARIAGSSPYSSFVEGGGGGGGGGGGENWEVLGVSSPATTTGEGGGSRRDTMEGVGRAVSGEEGEEEGGSGDGHDRSKSVLGCGWRSEGGSSGGNAYL